MEWKQESCRGWKIEKLYEKEFILNDSEVFSYAAVFMLLQK